jgi:tetratricopeptide (TPR) repeat protein
MLKSVQINPTAMVLSLLLTRKAKVGARNIYGQTPLHRASIEGKLEAVEILLAHKADFEAQDEGGLTSLHAAADHGSYAILELFLAKGGRVEAPIRDGRTALHMACQGGYLEAARLLLANKAPINAMSNAGLTPLHSAAWKGHLNLVKLLLANRADPLRMTSEGKSPWQMAMDFGHKDVADLLRNAVLFPNRWQVEDLLESAQARIRKQDHDGAIADCSKAIELNPRDANCYFTRGFAREKKRDFDGAIADLDRALELNPALLQVHYRRGLTYYDKQAWNLAVAEFRKAMELIPGSRDYSATRIWLARSREGEREAATEELRLYMAARKPEREDVWWTHLAGFLVGRQSEKELLASAKVVEGTDSKRDQEADACFFAASVRLIEGNRKGAQELFERCVAVGDGTSTVHASALAELEGLKERK